MAKTTITSAKIENAMRLAKRLVAEMANGQDAAFLASLKAFVGHLTLDSFLNSITTPLAANTKINFGHWYSQAKAAKEYQPPVNRHDEAALLFTLFQKIDVREISVPDFMMTVDGLMRMDKCYAEFATRYVERFIGYLEWIIQEKQFGPGAAGGNVATPPMAPRAPDLFAIELQQSVFVNFLQTLQQAIQEGLPEEEKAAALEDLGWIRRGFAGEATATEVTGATERLCRKYEYFRTRIQDFAWGAQLLHLPEDLPKFVKALRDGLGS